MRRKSHGHLNRDFSSKILGKKGGPNEQGCTSKILFGIFKPQNQSQSEFLLQETRVFQSTKADF